MKLGEALMIRADLNKRIAQVQARLGEAVLIQEGDEPPDDPLALLGELDGLFDQLSAVTVDINIANVRERGDLDGVNLGTSLLARNLLGKKIKAYQTVIGNASNSGSRYSRNEVKFVRTVDVAELQQKVDALSKQHRELDVVIQARNWEIDI